MKKINYFYLIIILLILLFSYDSFAGFQNKCGSSGIACLCGDQLNDSRTLVGGVDNLTGCNTHTILNLSINNILLDCAGNILGGNYSSIGLFQADSGNAGIKINSLNNQGYTNISIKNCIIEGVGVGVRIIGNGDTANILIQNNTFRNIMNRVSNSAVGGVVTNSFINVSILDNIFQNMSCSSCSGASQRIIKLVTGASTDSMVNVSVFRNKFFNISTDNNKIIDIGNDFSGSVSFRDIFINDNIFDQINSSIAIGVNLGVSNITIKNNTIKNFIVSDTAIGVYGIRITNTNFINISENVINNGNISGAIDISHSNNISVLNNTIKNFIIHPLSANPSLVGIQVENTTNINILDNIINNFTCMTCPSDSGVFGIGISFVFNSVLERLVNITIERNIISNFSGSSYGIKLETNGIVDGIFNNFFIRNNTLIGFYGGSNSAGANAISFTNFTNISIISNTIRHVSDYGFVLNNINNKNNQNNIIISNNNLFNLSYGFVFDFLYNSGQTTAPGTNWTLRDNIISNATVGIQMTNVTQLILINNTIANTTLAINGSALSGFKSILIYENQFSSLIWNQSNLTIYNSLGFGLMNSIVIGNNSAFVNTTNNPQFNIATNFTFFQQSFTANNLYSIFKDGSLCSGSVCIKQASNPVSISVTGFSNYSVVPDNVAPGSFSISSSSGSSFTHGVSTIISCSYSDDNPSSISISSSDGTSICSSSSSCSGSYIPSVGSKTITCTGRDVVGNSASTSLTLTVNQVSSSPASSASSGSSTATATTIATTTESTPTTATTIATTTESTPAAETPATAPTIAQLTKAETKIEEQKTILREADAPVVSIVEGISTVVESKSETVAITVSHPSAPPSGVLQTASVTVSNIKNEKASLEVRVVLDEKGLERPSLNSIFEIKELKKIPRTINVRPTANLRSSAFVGSFLLVGLLLSLFAEFKTIRKKKI